MSNYQNNTPIGFDIKIQNTNEDVDSFGDFKSASQREDELKEIMAKLDYIISEINMIKMEVREIKQNQHIECRTFHPIIPPPPKPVVYPIKPAYPGQPMPPYPHQQILYGNNNFSR
jgi:hypothetical protein